MCDKLEVWFIDNQLENQSVIVISQISQFEFVLWQVSEQK